MTTTTIATLAFEYALLRSVPRRRPPHHRSLGRSPLLFCLWAPSSFSPVNRTTSSRIMESVIFTEDPNPGASQYLHPQSPSVAADSGKDISKVVASIEDISPDAWDSREVPVSGEEPYQNPVSSVIQQIEKVTDESTTQCFVHIKEIKVDPPFLKFVIGKGGKTKQKIEKETTTKLYVPMGRKVKHGCCIDIKGPCQEKVDEAVSRIQTLLNEAEECSSLEYSHFISLPLAFHPALREQVTKFHDSVLSLKIGNKKYESVEYSDLCRNMINTESELEVNDAVTDVNEEFITFKKVRGWETAFNAAVGRGEEKSSISDMEEGVLAVCDMETSMVNDEDHSPTKQEDYRIDESIFIKPTRLHLTVLMLKLWNAERVTTAIKVLQSLKIKLFDVLDNWPLAVRLRGLECMKGSVEKAHVLYASVEEGDEKNRLIQACNIMREAFVDAGLVSNKEQCHKLKLHATMINTLHRKRKKGRKSSKRIPIDAREILFKHGADDWGEHLILEAHLSKRFAYGEDDYYQCCSVLRFPQVPGGNP